MSRPRKPGDPAAWPVPCGRCGEHHQLVATWPDAQVCGYCYQQAKRTRGTCACGHTGVLPGRLHGQFACRTCSGVQLNVDCRTCGAEDEIYSGGQCWTCVLAATVERLLTNPDTGVMTDELVLIAQALKSMTRANSGLTWLRQPHVTTVLEQLALEPVISHASIDTLPPSRTREYVRGLLVEHDALPRRDDLAPLFTTWAVTAVTRCNNPANRDLISAGRPPEAGAPQPRPRSRRSGPAQRAEPAWAPVVAWLGCVRGVGTLTAIPGSVSHSERIQRAQHRRRWTIPPGQRVRHVRWPAR